MHSNELIAVCTTLFVTTDITKFSKKKKITQKFKLTMLQNGQKLPQNASRRGRTKTRFFFFKWPSE